MAIKSGSPDGSPDGRRAPAWRDVEPALFPASVLEDHHAVVLNPATAIRLPGQRALRPTVYVSDSIIVPLDVVYSNELVALVREAAAEVGVQLPELDPDQLDRERDVARYDALKVT